MKEGLIKVEEMMSIEKRLLNSEKPVSFCSDSAKEIYHLYVDSKKKDYAILSAKNVLFYNQEELDKNPKKYLKEQLKQHKEFYNKMLEELSLAQKKMHEKVDSKLKVERMEEYLSPNIKNSYPIT